MKCLNVLDQDTSRQEVAFLEQRPGLRRSSQKPSDGLLRPEDPILLDITWLEEILTKLASAAIGKVTCLDLLKGINPRCCSGKGNQPGQRILCSGHVVFCRTIRSPAATSHEVNIQPLPQGGR